MVGINVVSPAAEKHLNTMGNQSEIMKVYMEYQQHPVESVSLKSPQDDMFNYQMALLEIGLFHKTKNGPGGNIPLDLALEHYNRLVKTVMRNLGPNASNPKALDRYCKRLAVNRLMLNNFDWVNNLKKLSGEHYRRSDRPDLLKIVNELIENQALSLSPGRQYKHFAGITDSLLTNFDMHDMYKWINEHRKNIYMKKCAR